MRHVPFLFSPSEVIPPHRVSENAWACIAQLRALEQRRYNYFSILHHVNDLTVGEAAVEGQMLIDSPFPFEVVGAELTAYGDSGETGAEDITLSCSLPGFTPLVLGVVHGGTARYTKTLGQGLQVAADSEVTFSISSPVTGSATINTYALLHCRYDMLSESTHTVPTPPSITDGSSYSVAAWNTWFSNMATALAQLGGMYRERKRIVVVNLTRNDASGIPAGVTVTTTDFAGTVDGVRGYVLSSDEFNINAFKNGTAEVYIDNSGITGTGVSTWLGHDFSLESAAASVSDLSADAGQVSAVSAGSLVLSRLYLQLALSGQGD